MNRNLPISGLSNVDFPYPLQGGMEFFEDFIAIGSNDYQLFSAATGKWMVGGLNGVVASVTVPAITTADGGANVCGAINLITTNGDEDDTFIQLRGGAFYCTTGRPMKFQTRFRVATVTACVQTFGMFIPTSIGGTTVNPYDTPLTYHGIGFTVVNGAVKFQVANATSGVSAQSTTGTIAASTAGVWNTLGFFYDGVSKITFLLNGKEIGTYSGAYIPTGLYLSPLAGITSTTAGGTPDMDIDYIACSVESPTNGR